jgi:hypothetical protein
VTRISRGDRYSYVVSLQGGWRTFPSLHNYTLLCVVSRYTKGKDDTLVF